MGGNGCCIPSITYQKDLCKMFFTITENNCCPDWLIDCQNWACGDALQDAALRSLFTSNRDPDCNEGGYWGNPNFGSGLDRTVIQNKRVNEKLADLEAEAESALAWMVSSGVVTDLFIKAEYESATGATLQISFSEPGTCDLSIPVTAGQYGWAWNYGRTV